MSKQDIKQQKKAFVSLSECADTLGISRTHLYTLISQNVLLPPSYCIESKKPFYCAEAVERNLEVMRTNIAISGKFHLFHRKHDSTDMEAPSPPRKRIRPIRPPSNRKYIIGGLRSLGMNASSIQVDAAISSIYPNGVAGEDDGEVLRAIYLYIKRLNSA